MPTRSPLTAIFDPRIRKGSVNPGAMLGINPCPVPNLSVLGHVTGINGAREVAVISSSHVAVSGSGAATVYIVDVSNPTSPSIVGSVGSITDPEGLAYSNNHIFVCRYGTSNPNDGLIAIDVSTPSSPSQVGAFTSTHLDGIRDVCISGTTAYVICETDRVISCIDISNPAAMTELGFLADYNPPHSGGFSIANAGSGLVVFVAWDSDSLGIVDVSNPSAPTLVGSLVDATHLGTAYGVGVRGTVAYVGANFPSQFTSVDISDPTTPAMLDSLSIATSFSDGPYGLALRPQCPYVYITNEGHQDAYAIDVSDPTNLSVADSLLNPTEFEIPEGCALSADGRYLYVADDFNDSLVVLAAV